MKAENWHTYDRQAPKTTIPMPSDLHNKFRTAYNSIKCNNAPTPPSPRVTKIPKFVKHRCDHGCHAVRGVKNAPYKSEMRVMRLNDKAVASGAPMKPSRKGWGPQTVETASSDIKKVTCIRGIV